jgi:hypothetical protein
MVSIEERVKSLEQEVAGMKALLSGPVSRKDGWESTVGAFEGDALFREALRLGREYRETQVKDEDREGA